MWRWSRAWLAILATQIMAGLTFWAPVADGQETVSGARLDLECLSVAPRLLWSGDIVRVDAVIVNRGNAPVYDLSVRVAVAQIGAPVRRWTPLQQHPADSIDTLAPGSQVHFSGTVRLEGNGWFEVGMAGLAPNRPLLLRGHRVWVIDPSMLLVEVAALFAVYAVLLSGAAGSIWWVLRPRAGAPPLVPFRPLVSIGFVLMFVGPALLWSIRERIIYGAGGMAFAPPWALSWLPLAGVASHAAGWLLVGAGLRPRGNVVRGGIVALGLYVLVGLAWVVGFNVSLGAPVIGLLHPGAFVLALIWPLQVAQRFGWFGLAFQ